MKMKPLGWLAILGVVSLLTGPMAQAGVVYDALARADLSITGTRLFDFNTGEFFDVARPPSNVLDVTATIVDDSGGAATFAGIGSASAGFGGSATVVGANPAADGVSQLATAQGQAQGTGASASSLYTTTSFFDLFFDPLADTSGFFLDGDVLAVDFLLDYELFVAAINFDPAEPVDAVATISLFSFFLPQTLDDLLGVGAAIDGSEVFGVDLFVSEQVTGADPDLALSGQLSFSLLLDSWFIPFDGLTLQVDVDGGGSALVPEPATLWLIGVGVLGLAVRRRQA